MTDEAAIDRAAPRKRVDASKAELISDGARTPARVGTAQLDDHRLGRRVHLVGHEPGALDWSTRPAKPFTV